MEGAENRGGVDPSPESGAQDGEAPMEVEHAHGMTNGTNGTNGKLGGEEEEQEEQKEEEEEPNNFHAEFMRAMRAEAEEAKRLEARAHATVLETADDHMDSLLEEFPDAAEAVAEKEESSDDDKPYVSGCPPLLTAGR